MIQPQIVVMPAVVQQQAPMGQTVDESLHVSDREKSSRSNEMKTTTQERRWSHAAIDYMVKTGQEVPGQRNGEQGEGGR